MFCYIDFGFWLPRLASDDSRRIYWSARIMGNDDGQGEYELAIGDKSEATMVVKASMSSQLGSKLVSQRLYGHE